MINGQFPADLLAGFAKKDYLCRLFLMHSEGLEA